MEGLELAVTYAINVTMALGAGYIGTSFMFYMAHRWPELGSRKQPVNIPLSLKAAETLPLELEQSEQQSKQLVSVLPQPLAATATQPMELAAPAASEAVADIPASQAPSQAAGEAEVSLEARSLQEITDDIIVADLLPSPEPSE
jgi:hypothetical protein